MSRSTKQNQADDAAMVAAALAESQKAIDARSQDTVEIYDGETGELIGRWEPAVLPMHVYFPSPIFRVRALKRMGPIAKGQIVWASAIYADGRLVIRPTSGEGSPDWGLWPMDKFVQMVRHDLPPAEPIPAD